MKRDPDEIVAKALLAYERGEIDRWTFTAIVKLANEIRRIEHRRERAAFWRGVLDGFTLGPARRWARRLFS